MTSVAGYPADRDDGLAADDESSGPGLDVLVLLTPLLLERADPSTAARIADSLSRTVGRFAAAPHRPVVRLDAAVPVAPDPFAQIFIDGQACPLSQVTLLETLAYVAGDAAVPSASDAVAVSELLESAGGEPTRRLEEWLALLCLGAVAARAEASPHRRVPAEGLDPLDWIDPAEPLDLEIAVEPTYLRTLTLTAGDYDAAALFPFARDGLFMELGVPLPPFHLRRDPSLRPGGFTVRLHGIGTPPRIGLPEGTILVNDTPERLSLLEMGIAAQATLNPATGQPGAIVAAEHDEALVALGLTTWTPLGYLILAFAETVRRKSYLYVTAKTTERILDNMSQAYPTLAEVARAFLSLDELSAVLRELVREQVSVRNLRRILELLLECATEDVPPANRLAVIRSGLADLIAHKAGRGTGTVVAYLIDPELESAVAAAEERPGADEQLRAALAAEIVHLPPTAQVPVILTQDSCRLRVRDALVARFPRMIVLGYGDLPADINIQPVARISATS
jgi:hypothetical protein